MTLKVVVLASGTGSLFRSLLEARNDSFEIVALVTDNPTAGAIAIASRDGVVVRVVELQNFADRAEWDEALTAAIEEFHPELVVSAGFMRVLGATTLAAFPNRIINTHPALLPLYPGAHAVRDALAAGASETGSTVHVVEAVAVLAGDDEAALHERIKVAERRLLVEVVTRIAKRGLTVHDRKATIA